MTKTWTDENGDLHIECKIPVTDEIASYVEENKEAIENYIHYQLLLAIAYDLGKERDDYGS